MILTTTKTISPNWSRHHPATMCYWDIAWPLKWWIEVNLLVYCLTGSVCLSLVPLSSSLTFLSPPPLLHVFLPSTLSSLFPLLLHPSFYCSSFTQQACLTKYFPCISLTTTTLTPATLPEDPTPLVLCYHHITLSLLTYPYTHSLTHPQQPSLTLSTLLNLLTPSQSLWMLSRKKCGNILRGWG